MNRNIVLLLKQLNLSLEQYGRAQMKQLDLSPSQSFALDFLFDHEGKIVYATEMHEQFGISKAAISATLKGLRHKGYLDMMASPEDDRKKQIVLTEKAYALKEKIDASLLEQQNRLCRNIPQQRLALLEEDLNKMLHNLRPEMTGREEA